MYRGPLSLLYGLRKPEGAPLPLWSLPSKIQQYFSNYSPQDLTNANRSYSKVFVQGNESARGIAFQQRWMVKRSLTDFFFSSSFSSLKTLPSALKFSCCGAQDFSTARLSRLFWFQHQRSFSRRSSQNARTECNQRARIINSHPRYLPLPGVSVSLILGFLV